MSANPRRWLGRVRFGFGGIAALLALIAVAMGVVTLLRVGDGGDQQASQPEQISDYVRTHDALCDAASAIRTTNVPAAQEAFYGRAHSGLHGIADELAEVDRALAADLLRAKNAVEGAFGASSGPRLKARLDELLRVSQMALESLGEPYSPCTF